MDDYSDVLRDTDAADNGELTDHWGNYWPVQCPQCGEPAMVVMQAGRAICEKCGYVTVGQGARKEL